MKNGAWVLGILVVLLSWGCASGRPAQQTSNPSDDPAALRTAEVEPRARNAFQLAERASKAHKSQAAIDAYRAIKRDFPGGPAHELASYRLGTLYYATSNYPQAMAEFQSFLNTFPQSELIFDVTYNLAATEYQQGAYARASETLSRLPKEIIHAQGPRRAEVVYQLGAQAAAAAQNRSAVVVYLAQNLQLPLEEGRRQTLENNVSSTIQDMTAEELTAALPKVSEPATRAKITQRLASSSTAVAAAPVVLESTPDTAGGALGRATSGDRSRIGVVLPLTGAQAQYGKRALDGILLAAGIFSDGGSEFEILAEDSGSNPAQAALAVDKLVEEKGVIAIIGPIAWKESLAVADRAQELGVLNLSLTGKEGLSERGGYLFQNALTARVQMENLVRYASQERDLKRFAILAPDNSFGEDMASQFTAVADKLGGRVVAFERYPADAKDFQDAVQRLLVLSDSRARKLELSRLDTFAKEQQAKTRRPSKARLPPVVDFDAVFLPDGPRAAAQIAASLAYFDVADIPLLGTSEWNSDQLHKRGGRLVEKALFPGALVLGSDNPKQKEFARAYTEAYGILPDLLAAQSFEALELVARAARSSGGNRNAAVSALLSGVRFESPLGELGFDQNRTALRNLPILGLAPGGAIIAQ
ncbi:penicillin-binding protein activator [bacterium]|nr:penicillin-binding protein activator [bacterium]